MRQIARRLRKGNVRLCPALDKEVGELIVWWYGGITKNNRAQTVPKVVVFFRRLETNGNIGSWFRKEIALTFLGILRIGTIWESGVCNSEVVFQKQNNLHIDFTSGAWRYASPSECAKEGSPSLINPVDYPLPFDKDRNWLLDFPLPDGKSLLIPCLELFVRIYGRSEEVKRVLSTYSWEKVEEHFYKPFDQPHQPGTWPIKLKKRLYNSDTIFLAHAKHDPYTTRAAKHIYSQIEAAFKRNNLYAFIKVSPWFEGPAEINVSGYWINGGKTFLALRVDGYNYPQGWPIQRDRENPNNAERPAEGEGVSEGWKGAPSRILKPFPDILDLTDDDEPDHGAAIVEVEEDDCVMLGKPRVIIDVRREQAKTSGGNPGDGGNPRAYSSGESHGEGKGVGYASIHSKEVMESDGMLYDMWEAMIHLAKKQPKLITSVEWFTFEHGLSKDSKPGLIALRPFAEKDDVKPDVRSWPYLDSAGKKRRGILIARVMADGKVVHIIEIERKQYLKRDSAGNVTMTEEPFKGLVFMLHDQTQFEQWLRIVLSQVRYAKGIVQKLANSGDCPGKVSTVSHLDGVYRFSGQIA